MAVSKKLRARSTGQEGLIGLAGIGSSGPWEIAIDQTVSGPTRWFVQVEGPLVYLYFEIPSLEVVEQAIGFLGSPDKTGDNTAPIARDGTLAFGASRSTRVDLLRDDEFHDRYFLVIKPKSGPLIRLTLASDDLTDVVNALRQAKEDLE